MEQSPPKESRPPINLRIKFRSESVEQFIERYAVDVSRGGIFIRTREPLAVGTQLKLDFQFQNGSALMSGDGTVVWIREVDPNRASVPPGMGVRFDKLTPESQAVLEQLLVEKAKRERGGIPGSAGQGAGGIAVRRSSSMFSVLEPPGGASAKADQAAAPVLAPVTAPGVNPAALPATATTAAPAAPAAPASSSYRPLGTARNPFSAVTGTGAAIPSKPAASPDIASARPTGSRISQRLTPTEAAAHFDDFNDEPTQIAGNLPSFLTSDEEATSVAAPAFAGAKREVSQQPAGTAATAPGETPKTPPPEARRLPGSVGLPGSLGMKVQPPERKTGAQIATSSAAESFRRKQSLDQVPPFAAEPAEQPSPFEQHAKESPRDTAKDVAATSPDAPRGRQAEKTTLPITSPTAPSPAEAPRLSAEAPALRPSAAAVAIADSDAAAASAAPARATTAAGKVASIASPAHAAPQQAAKVQPAQPVKKRSSAALVGLTVVVLGAAAIFVFRFFGSQATESISPSSAPVGTVATGDPTTLTGPPQTVQAPEATNPAAAPAGTVSDPAGAVPAAPSATAPPTLPEPTAAATPTEPTVAKSDSPALHAAPRASIADVKPNVSATAEKKGGKAKSARGSRETGAATATTAPPNEPKPVQPEAAGSAPIVAAGAPSTATTAPSAAADGTLAATEPDATAHQIRVTSKPAGADVALDGQTVGKTPYSIGIADVSAPHFIAVRKDGFEPFEQMISASSTWTKTKGQKGKAALHVLKINAKLKQTGGTAAAGPVGAGGESKPTTDPPAAEANPAAKVEGVRPDRPLPPSEERAPAESPP